MVSGRYNYSYWGLHWFINQLITGEPHPVGQMMITCGFGVYTIASHGNPGLLMTISVDLYRGIFWSFPGGNNAQNLKQTCVVVDLGIV